MYVHASASDGCMCTLEREIEVCAETTADDACAYYVSVTQMHVHAFASRLTRRRVVAAHELELVAMTALLIASKHQELSPQGVQVSAAAFYS